MSDAEALVLQIAIAVGDHRAALAELFVQVADNDITGVLHICDGIGQVALVTVQPEILACPRACKFRHLKMARQRFSNPSAIMQSIWTLSAWIRLIAGVAGVCDFS